MRYREDRIYTERVLERIMSLNLDLCWVMK